MIKGEIDFSDLKNKKIESDVAIVVNFGGWGNVPMHLAADLKPTVDGIRYYLESRGLRTMVLIYRRARPDVRDQISFESQVAVITELLGLHQTRARRFAAEVETVAAANLQTKFILIGLSNGGGFVDNTMALLSPKLRKQIVGVTIGVPFWRGVCEDSSILHIANNSGTDPLASGEVEELLASLITGFFNLVWQRIKGKELRFQEVWHIQGHNYEWQSIKPVVSEFLDWRLFNNNRN